MIYQILTTWLILWIVGPVLSENSTSVKDNKGDDICTTIQCERVGGFFKFVMNETVNPCNDFHEYACGKWHIKYPIPKTKSFWNLDTIVEDALHQRLIGLLRENVKPNDALKKEKLWYRSCMDIDGIEKLDVKPMKNIINGIGGWPMLRKSHEWTNYTWQKVHDYYHETAGLQSLFLITIYADSRNSSRNIINLDQPDETMLEEMLTNVNSTKIIKKYSELIENMTLILARHSNINLDVNEVRKDVEAVVEFEKALHSIKATPVDKVDVERMLNWMTIEELQVFYDLEPHATETSKINWLSVINETFSHVEDVEINSTEEIQVKETQYLRKLSQLLDQIPERTIVNYIHWRFIFKTMKYLNNETSNLYLEIVNEHTGSKAMQPRYEMCLLDLITKMDVTISFEFIKSHIPTFSLKMAEEMVQYVREAMKRLIQQSSWVDEETKNETMKKLQTMKQIIGYTDLFKNESAVLHYYDKLNVTSTNYYENIIRYSKFSENYLQYLRKPKPSHLQVVMNPITSNAMYMPDKNRFILTAAKLISPLFHPSNPSSVNYGTIGWIIGHEISHGIDAYGRYFDMNGNVVDWWPKNMVTTYNSKSQCYIKQYDNLQGNGNLTMNENMADANGLEAAFMAYKDALKNKNIKDQKLRGLEHLEGDKLFFISYAVGLCQAATPEFLKVRRRNDYHSAPKYRINGGVTNVETFAKAFNCSVGSPLNPVERCNIWK